MTFRGFHFKEYGISCKQNAKKNKKEFSQARKYDKILAKGTDHDASLELEIPTSNKYRNLTMWELL